MSGHASPARFAWALDLGLSVPVICAPMGGAAGGRLAGAVSHAGALGMIGMGSSASTDALRRELDRLPPETQKLGIGLVDWVVQREPALLDLALQARPTLVSVNFGDWDTNWDWWLSAARESGAATAVQVATVEQARRAEDAGVDLIVARGLEAGGHGEPRRPLVPLLESVLASVTRPVLAAGGITTGDDLAAVLQLGAAGAWIGTAFAAARESALPPEAQSRLLAAKAADTAISRVTDTALGYPWPPHLPERVIATAFERSWRGREQALIADAQALAAFTAAVARGDFTTVPVNAGTGVERVEHIRDARMIVSEFASVLEAAGWSA